MELAEMLCRTTVVRVVRGGQFDPQHKAHNEVLARVEDERSVAQLVGALAVGGLDEQVALMTPGSPSIAFFEGREYLGFVTVVGRWLRWSGWPFDAPLVDPDRLEAWLAKQGVEAN